MATPQDVPPQTAITITASCLRDGNMIPTTIGTYLNITGQATTVVKSGNGFLYSIVLNNPVATETITMYDNTAGSGTKIGTITIPATPQPVAIMYNANFLTGLTIVTATASSDITVVYR